MTRLNDYELKNITGGSLSGTIISAIIRGVGVFVDVGRAIGTAVRRICSNKVCPV